jgi:predicted ATPase
MAPDRRPFGPGPYLTGLRRRSESWGSGFPFDLPAVADVEKLRLDVPVTFLVGENGSGKSTLIEAIARVLRFDEEGGTASRSSRSRRTASAPTGSTCSTSRRRRCR